MKIAVGFWRKTGDHVPSGEFGLGGKIPLHFYLDEVFVGTWVVRFVCVVHVVIFLVSNALEAIRHATDRPRRNIIAKIRKSQ